MDDNKNIVNSPVTTQIGNRNSNPTNNSGVSPIKIKGAPRKTKAQLKQEALDNTPVDPYEVAKSRETLKSLYTSRNFNETYVNNPYGSDYFKNRWMGIEFDPVSTDTQDFVGGINPFAENYDFEHLRRESQGTLAAAGNIATQFVGKTVVNTAGGLIAGFYGLGSAVANWDSTKVWDNSVARGFDSASEWVDQNNTVFTSEYARNNQSALNIFNVEGAKNLSDGFSFVAGAILSEVIMGAVTGGTANALKASTWGAKLAATASKANKITAKHYGSILSKAKTGSSLAERGNAIKRAASLSDELLDMSRLSTTDDLAKLEKLLPQGTGIEDLQKLASVRNTLESIPVGARKLVTGTSWEAGLEARQAKDEFYESNMEKARNDVSMMTHLTEQERAKLLADKEKQILEMSNSVGHGVFALNTAVLAGSNLIQFPTLFGMPKVANPKAFGDTKAFGKKLFSGPYKKTGSTLSDEMYSLRKGAKAKLIAKSFGSILKDPLTEGLEEMTQSAISGLVTSYYDDKLNNPFQDHLLNEANADFMTKFKENLVVKQLADTFTDEDAYKEGVIGAVMGLVGVPIFRKNKNGKLRPKMVGGIWDDISAVGNAKKAMNNGLIALNDQSKDLTSIMGMNKEQALINKKLSEKDDLANLTGQERIIHDNQEQRISEYVTRMKKLGLESQMNEIFDDIKNSSFEDYKKMFNKDESFTKEEMNQELNRFKESTDRYSKAYDTLYKHLNLEAYAEDSTTVTLIDTLVNAIGYEKYSKQKDAILINRLVNSKLLNNLDLTESQITSMINNSAEFEGVKAEYDKIMSDLSQNKKAELQSNIETLAQESENYISSLPNEMKVPAKKLMEALDSGNSESIEKALETLKNVTLTEGSPISHNEVNQTLTSLMLNNQLIQSNMSLFNDPSVIEKWALSEDPEQAKEAKKVLEEVKDRLNKTITENHKKQTESFIKKKEEAVKNFSVSDLLKYLETNSVFLNIENEYNNNLDDTNIEDALLEDYLNIQQIKHELLFSANKRLSTTQLAKEMLSMGGLKAYNKIQIDTYNAGLRNLQFAIINSEIAMSEGNENEIVFNAVSIKTILKKLEEIKQEIIQKKSATEKDFKDSNLIKRANSVLELLSQYIDKADIQEKAAEQARKEKEEALAAQAFKKPSDAKDDSDDELGALKIVEANQNGGATSNGTVEKNPAKKPDESGVGTGSIPGKEEGSQSNDPLEESNETEVITTSIPINSLNATALDPKMMFTLSGNTTSVNNRDIRSESATDEKDTLQYKIDVQHEDQIRYNQGGTLIVPDLDPLVNPDLSEDEKSRYRKAIFNNSDDNQNKIDEETYLRGLSKLNQENALEKFLSVDSIDEMDSDVRFYISKTRIVLNIYRDEVKISERNLDAPQQLNLPEDADPIHSMYLFSAINPNKLSDVEDARIAYEKEISEISNNYLSALQKINDSDDNLIQKEKQIAFITNEKDKAIRDSELKYQQKSQGLNDVANFSLRLNAIKAKLSGEVSKIRVGNFLNGNLPKALGTEFADESVLVETYPLDKGENALFNENDPFSPEKLAYVNNDGQLVSYKTGKVVKLNKGSLVEKQYLSSGKMYAIITTNNGQQIPIKINTERFGSQKLNPELIKEISNIITDYTNLEGNDKKSKATAIIKLSDNTLFGYASGMTYEQFFSSISRKWRSNSSSISSELTGFINIKGDNGNLVIGGEEIFNDTDPESKQQSLNKALALLQKNKFFVNESILYKTDSNGDKILNQKYLDFLIDNNIISHTIETSKMKDRVFERGENDKVKMQIHLLNDGMQQIGKINKASKLNSFNKKRDLIHKLLFGKAIGKDDKLKDTVSINNLMQGILRYLSSNMANSVSKNQKLTDAEKLTVLNNIIDETIKDKLEGLNEILFQHPEMRTENLLKWLKGGGSKSSLRGFKPEKALNYLETYIYHALFFLNDIKNKPANLDAIIQYGSNIDYSTKIRKLLLKPDNKSSVIQITELSENTNKNDNFPGEFKPAINPDKNSLDFRVAVAHSSFKELENKISSLPKDGAEIVEAKKQLEVERKKYEALRKEKIDRSLELINHILLIGNTINKTYAIETYFGKKAKNEVKAGDKVDFKDKLPNFQFNHSQKGNFSNKVYTNRYLINEEGITIKDELKDSFFHLEEGSLYSNSNRSPFSLKIKGKNASGLIKNSTSVSSINENNFDELGNPKDFDLVAHMVKIHSDKDSKKIKEQNDALTDKKYSKNEKFEIIDVSVMVGSEKSFRTFKVFTEISLPGINPDLTIDKEIQELFINYSVNFRHNYDTLMKLASPFKDNTEVVPETQFSNLNESKTLKSTSEDVEQYNKDVTVPEVSQNESSTNSSTFENMAVKSEITKETEIEAKKNQNGVIVEGFIIPNRPVDFDPSNVPSDTPDFKEDLGINDDVPKNEFKPDSPFDKPEVPSEFESKREVETPIIDISNGNEIFNEALLKFKGKIEMMSSFPDFIPQQFESVFDGSLGYKPTSIEDVHKFVRIIFDALNDIDSIKYEDVIDLQENFINLADEQLGNISVKENTDLNCINN